MKITVENRDFEMANLTREKIEALLATTETFRVERTTSTTDTEKFCEAICSFANDMPDARTKGYLFIGAYDDGLMQHQAIQAAKSALTASLSAQRKSKIKHVLMVFDLISQNSEISVSALSDAVSLSRRAVSGYIDEMKSLGILKREGGSFGGRWRILAGDGKSKF